jgi:uncharacterized RDD family membrane protein YckC
MSSAPPDTLRVSTADNVAIGYSVAGVGSRMVAQLLDNLCALLLVLLALLAYLAIASAASTPQGALWGLLGAVGFATFVYFGFFLVSEVVSGGRTPGKSVMGLRVIRLDGSAPDVPALLVRNLVRIVDVIAGIGLVVMFFHLLARRLGDIAAGTVVVRDRASVSLATAVAPPPVLLRTPDAGPAIDGIERLGTVEYNALRVFLSRPGLAPDLRTRLAADMAARLCNRLQLAPAAPERMWPPELLIERLYLQLDHKMR